MYFSVKEADKAAASFDKMFKRHELPKNIPEVKISGAMKLIDVLVLGSLVTSKSDARRQIEQGGVKVDGQVVKNPLASVQQGSVIQKGKRYFIKVVR